MVKIEIVQGDITQETTDAIVNAANSTLMGGGGVDGAIHRAAGPELLRECRALRHETLLSGLATGEAIATKAYNLSAKTVIHTVGPVWNTSANAERSLTKCYISCLKVADSLGAKSISFPAISTGAYGYPPEKAAPVAIAAVRNAETNVKLVRFVLFDEFMYKIYEQVL
jgi:O-acetyl-ADP-ribose deacetylase (regulator of RNase III)